MSEWRETTLGDVADLLVGYAYRSSAFTSDPSETRLLRGVNIGQGFLDWGNTAFWPSEGVAGSRYQLTEGDVVLAMDRPWIEAGLKRARLRADDLPALLVQRVARLRGTPAVRTSFLHHLLATETFSRYLQGIVTGATVPHISQRQIEGFRFRLPPIPVQDSMCEVLDSIDDLIENNRRWVAVLEEMARAIYREWFVHYRYPGHEHVPLVDSPLGPIPDGWTVGRSGDLQQSGILDIGDGYRAKNAEMTGGDDGLPFVRVANVRDGSLAIHAADRLPLSYRPKLKSKVSRPGDVVISMKGTVGRQALVRDWHPPMAYSPQVSYWRALDRRRVTPSFLYEWIRSDAFAAQCAAVKGGTAMADYVNLTDQRRMYLKLPPAGLMGAFSSAVDPILDLAGTLQASEDRLADIRDFLLPKLVTGQIDVWSLDLDALSEGVVA